MSGVVWQVVVGTVYYVWCCVTGGCRYCLLYVVVWQVVVGTVVWCCVTGGCR